MSINGHHIIDFAKQRWHLTKRKIAEDYLGCDPAMLSRKKPPTIEPAKYYNRLFKVSNSFEPSFRSAAMEFEENETALLDAFRDYLIKAECIREANYIFSEMKKDTKYEKIIKEILRRANTQPSPGKEHYDDSKTGNTLPNSAVDNIPSIESHPEQGIDQIRDRFLEIIHGHGVMEIINRKPAILYRIDSTKLNVCIRKLDSIFVDSSTPIRGNKVTNENILIFTETLHLQALSIEATMNNNFDSYDENAFLIMESVDDFPKSKRQVTPRKKRSRVLIPELSTDIIKDVSNPLWLLDIAVKEWDNFRDEMNFLYKEILGQGQ